MVLEQGSRYADPVYQAAHEDTFSKPVVEGVPAVLPPGVSRQDFDDALEKIAKAIGEGAIFKGEALKEYVDPYEIPEGRYERNLPGAAVCPASVEELQAALKVVNDFKIPVWTISRGKNLGYGGPAPLVNGSIIMDLHRMDKILEVNEKFGYAVVEPGVTFGDLYAYCTKNKLKVWPSTASLGWGSVVGNTLDRGMGFVPSGIHHENMAGLEVVLANGDIVRTGQFAMSTSTSAHLTHLSFGPTIDGLFLQSNLGIVTKLGIHMTPQPQAFMACTFDMPEFDDIETITDVFGSLRRSGVLPTVVYVFSLVEWSAIKAPRHTFWDKEGPIPEWRLKEMQEELDVGFWTVKWGLYGPKNILQAQYDEVQRVVGKEAPTGRLRNVLFSGGEDGGLLEALDVPQPYGGMFVGVPSMFSIPMVSYYNPQDGSGVGAHGAYSPIVPLDGKTMREWVTVARKVYESQGLDLLCDFFMGQRHAVFVCMLCFDKTNPQQRQAIDSTYNGLFEAGTRMGLAKYRSHVNHMDQTAELFDFNDHAYRRFVETIKDSLDPNGVLSPGKMGIWPKRFREMRSTNSRHDGAT
ncbi:4-cresol dehydrogenase [Cryphonectria parasitica EP155]|uniref:4-cresol dehydrogenase n=1 Tax=Cryphonectria parasitica (strain ATCC 38755 / EP155) TaxID=660469 RepID=A0A9P5CPM6_CRYP1|nr:4-cresol dehydrogenase [Cryphonectria parasitica EP155]KAF3765572.1 4-cresol dehydrogenase [Cryphonectria parasitica EP155]